MSIEFNSLFVDVQSSIYSVSFVNYIFSNLIYTSIILSIILLIIVIFLYPQDGSESASTVRLFIYIFIATTITFSLYNGFLNNKFKEKYHDSNHETLISKINKAGGNSAYSSDAIKINPNFKSSHSYDTYEDSNNYDNYNDTQNKDQESKTVDVSQILESMDV
jgi:hypothetical protein